MKKTLNSLLLLFVFLLSGCSGLPKTDAEIAKWLVPINITAAYFGSVGLHEGGHAIPALALGADRVKVDVLPAKDMEGHFHLGLTTYRYKTGKFSDTDFTIINTMGPTAQFVGHVASRELLLTHRMPRLIQPTLSWFSLFNQIGFYFHTINGLARNDRTDLGKEHAWISGAMLLGGLTYDLIDIFGRDDKPENRVLNLFGEYFYEPKDKGPRLSFMTQPRHGGGFMAVRLDW